ncbi:MAG: hypothetical protein PVH41_17215 [Anaerolineae bacterium]
MSRLEFAIGRRQFVQVVEIRIAGRIDERWSDWFADLAIRHTEKGETVLTGAVEDQAALYGLLAKLRDLGLPLVSVSNVEDDSGDEA